MSTSSSTPSALKLALLARQARMQTSAIARAEPIAIIGIGCRFPGGADSPEGFWRLLRAGTDAVGEIPSTRWDVDAYFDPDPATPGKSYIRHAALLDRIDDFDAAFFGILPREAERMDPQQRIFMEVAIDALDHAGLARERLSGSRTGVFVASYHSDYAQLQYADPEWIDSRTLTGILHSIIPNRLSYWLNLRGPSVSIDSACSSSLVAVHLACQSLRWGESDIALAGGVNIMAAPDLMIPLSKVGFTSTRGRCRTFDAGADGFVRGEGCGAIVLKRLSDAVAAGDRILSVIRSSVVNQDGRSTVMAAPNGLAQQALVREALEIARIEPSRIGLLETHGTGTALGDPIEVEALAAVIGAPRADGSVCYLGATKANIGHLEAAAGIAGLIKATLAMRAGEIPGQVHFERLNPHLSLDGTCLRVSRTPQRWPAGAAPRVAGVSSFGVGGTNAHVILEEAPALAPEPGSLDASAPGEVSAAGPFLLPLSAQSPNGLKALAARWIEFLPGAAGDLAAVCTAAGERRSHYDYRLGIVGGSVEEFQARLGAFLAGTPSPAVAAGHASSTAPRRLAFVFCGQGPQWYGMGRELAVLEPVFREALIETDAIFRRHAPWSLLEELAAPEDRSRLVETEIAQPAIFAIQVALAALWRSWGVEPDAVVGHSIGELAALHVAGVLSLDEAARIVRHRALAMQRATGLGAMASVSLDLGAAEALVRAFGTDLSVAAVNSPQGIVLSGRKDALAAALAELDRRGVSHRPLPVNYAFHSAQMHDIAREFVASLGAVTTVSAHIPVYSTVSGRVADDSQFAAGYFERNVRQTVRFAAAIESMLQDGFATFLEIGPHPVLGSSIAECAGARGEEVTLLASLRRNRPEREMLLQACAGVFASVRAPSWPRVNHAAAALIDLPAYPWQRERFWVRQRPARRSVPAGTDAGAGPGPHELLGERVAAAAAAIFSASWPHGAPAWLADHRIAGRLVMPAAAMLEALRAAACERLGARHVELRDFVVHHPLVLPEPEGAGLTWQITAQAGTDARLGLTLHERLPAAQGERAWRLIASAEAARADGGEVAPSGAPPANDGASADSAQRESLYAAFAEAGIAFGPAFRTIERLETDGSSGHGWLRQSAGGSSSADDVGVHATMLDGAWQMCAVAASAGGDPHEVLLPVGVDRYTVLRPAPARMQAHVEISRVRRDGAVAADIKLSTPDGALVALLEGVRLARTSRKALKSLGESDDWLYEIAWRTCEASPSPSLAQGAWIILCDAAGLGDALADALIARGARCLRVRQGAGWQRTGADARTIDPARSDQWDTLIGDDAWRAGLELTGIVHLWSLDVTPLEQPGAEPTGQRLEADDLRTGGSALLALQSLLRSQASQKRLVLVTAGAQAAAGAAPSRPSAAGLWGFLAAAVAELPDLPCRIIDLDADAPPDALLLADEIDRAEGAPQRLALRGALRLVPYIRKLRRAGEMTAAVRLHASGSGTLDSIEWRPMKGRAPRADEARVRIRASGLNFRDVLLALGMYPNGQGVPLGGECAGIVESVGSAVTHLRPGDVVFGFAPASLATECTVPAAFLAPVPRRLTIEQAAAQPAAYLTAMLGLSRKAAIRHGMRVLVHAAAGGVGMAAVRIAQRAGAEVFATAGTPAKRELLRALGVRHVFDSRSTRFVDEVAAATGGAGVDIVLNSLAGEFIPAGFSVLGRGGCFLELGKRDIWSPEHAARIRPDVRYWAYDLGAEAEADPALLRTLMSELAASLESGALRPLPVRVFEFQDAPLAFRFMAQARHTGKIVLRAPRDGRESAAAPRIVADATYLISGGLGALGVRTARWLVQCGARHIVLVGRGAPGPEAEALMRDARQRGATILARRADVGDGIAMREVLEHIRGELPPLRGIIHAAGMLSDGVLLHQDLRRWRDVLHGKAHGARILHELTRDVPLDFFVLYSAAGVLLGPAGQGPYAAANAELDALAQARRSAGLPALSVAWGMWSEAGMAASTAAGGHDAWSARGLGWITPDDGFDRLERLLGADVAHAAVLPIDWARFAALLPSGVDPDYFRAVLPASERTTVAAEQSAVAAASRVSEWRRAPESERRTLALSHVTELARAVLGLGAAAELDAHAPLKDAGLDSLMAVELRNALTRSIGQPLPATLLFDYPTLDAVATHLLRTLDLMSEPITVRPDPRGAATAAIAALSEAEAEAELLAELSGSAERRLP
jgi:acyl transferase domain-containing protein/NADPH:quinone reductase-like Zn-dependent oxidoreductase/acyl carrier protein